MEGVIDAVLFPTAEDIDGSHEWEISIHCVEVAQKTCSIVAPAGISISKTLGNTRFVRIFMVTTRSGKKYGYDYDPWHGLSPDISPSTQWTDEEIIAIVEPSFRAMASDKKFNTTTGNIAALIAKFEAREAVVDFAYSTNSSLEWEKIGQYGLVGGTTNFPAEFSAQSNSQARNHTEPKLLQDFADTFLHEGSPITKYLRWVVVVTDRPCCGTCLSGSINPFANWARANKIAFYVLDLQGKIQNKNWTSIRSNFT